MCEQCNGPLPTIARRHARTCSTRCRVAKHRANQPPKALTQRDRWVRWDLRLVRRKKTKVPLTVASRAASSTNPATWSSYREVRQSTVGTGIGFVLNGDGIVCLDLDHCLIDGEPTTAAADLLATLPPTYIEVSPSGDGLHVWGTGQLAHGRRTKVGGTAVEAYATGRYMTVTGKRWSSTAHFADLSEALAAL